MDVICDVQRHRPEGLAGRSPVAVVTASPADAMARRKFDPQSRNESTCRRPRVQSDQRANRSHRVALDPGRALTHEEDQHVAQASDGCAAVMERYSALVA
jgi:hypothetical protein